MGIPPFFADNGVCLFPQHDETLDPKKPEKIQIEKEKKNQKSKYFTDDGDPVESAIKLEEDGVNAFLMSRIKRFVL